MKGFVYKTLAVDVHYNLLSYGNANYWLTYGSAIKDIWWQYNAIISKKVLKNI